MKLDLMGSGLHIISIRFPSVTVSRFFTEYGVVPSGRYKASIFIS